MVLFSHINFHYTILKLIIIPKLLVDSSIVPERIIYLRNDPLTPADIDKTRLRAFKVLETTKLDLKSYFVQFNSNFDV